MDKPIFVETTTESTETSGPETVPVGGVFVTQNDTIMMPVTVKVVKVTITTQVGVDDLDKVKREALLRRLLQLDA